jgi:hypothetical protein
MAALCADKQVVVFLGAAAGAGKGHLTVAIATLFPTFSRAEASVAHLCQHKEQGNCDTSVIIEAFLCRAFESYPLLMKVFIKTSTTYATPCLNC